MSNLFDLQDEDQCLQFIRQDSFQGQADLFENIPNNFKNDPDNEAIQIQQSQQVSRKRNRNQNGQRSNSKKKVFYRDKMANLISQQDMKRCQGYNYGDYAQSARGKSPITRDQQLRRNRQSAKHSRQRRKQYVETLQLKNEQNQKKIEELTLRLRQVQLQRDRLKEDNRSYIRNFLTAKNEAYENLSQVLQKTSNRSDEKLNQQIKLLIARYGAAGSERVATTDYYMKQIIEILLGDVHKYIVDCAVNDSGLFGLGGWTSLDDEVCKILKVTKQSRVKLSKSYKFQMMQQFDTFKAVTQNFYDAYRAVQNQAKIIEKIFEKISIQFNDCSIAELLLWLEQNKFSRELKKIRAEWARSVQNSEQARDKPRKISTFQIYE